MILKLLIKINLYNTPTIFKQIFQTLSRDIKLISKLKTEYPVPI